MEEEGTLNRLLFSLLLSKYNIVVQRKKRISYIKYIFILNVKEIMRSFLTSFADLFLNE